MENLLFVAKCWYVSKNGTDNDSCGRISSDPCKSVDELLTVIHDDIYPNKNSTKFCIVTDFSLLINRTLMVRS